MTTEAKIREAFEIAKKRRMEMPEVFKADLQYYLFEAGYKAGMAEAFESDAKLCDENACDYTREGAEVCAAAIRKRAKEKQNA